jgi:Caspase domain
MSTVVQATCPGCKHVLRIPADWLGQAFKCKHCGTVIQARAKAPEPAPTTAKPVARPVAQPAGRAAAPKPAPKPVKKSAADPFSFDGDGEPVSSPRSRPRRRSRGGLITGLILAALVLILSCGGAFFGWPYLSAMMAKNPDGIAQNDDPDKKDGDDPKDSPAPRSTQRKPDLPVKLDTGRKPERPDPSTGHGTPPKPDLPVAAGPFPRRALAISINDYLFANPINYGTPMTGGPNVQALLDRFGQAAGLRIPSSQVGILSDAARTSVAPTEPVIRNTIVNFLKESRAQDRIILLIVGHVVEAEGEIVLLPIDGMTDSKEGTIPLKWVYDQLAACKARQKVLILDTCRLDPSKGQERPGSGPMGAKLDAMLKEPPPGVQVWTACVAEQFSYEFEGGENDNNGVFLQALWNVSYDISKGKIQSPTDSLPLERLVEAVNAEMKEVLGKLGKVQTSRLTGSEAEEGAEPDPKEPMPQKPQAVASRPGKNADLTLVRAILKDISFPPLKVAKDRKSLTAEALPPFPADTLKEYMKDGEATPLRAEVMKARGLLAEISSRNNNQLTGSYRAEAEGPLKERVRRDQKTVAKVIGELMDESDALKAVADNRKEETKRWQATYDYVVARMDAQIAYLNEYQAVLGQILKGLAPPDPNLYNGWRLASQYDPQTGDSTSKKLATESRKKLDKIIAAYPNTPWAIMAKRDRTSGLGLEWQPVKR